MQRAGSSRSISRTTRSPRPWTSRGRCPLPVPSQVRTRRWRSSSLCRCRQLKGRARPSPKRPRSTSLGSARPPPLPHQPSRATLHQPLPSRLHPRWLPSDLPLLHQRTSTQATTSTRTRRSGRRTSQITTSRTLRAGSERPARRRMEDERSRVSRTEERSCTTFLHRRLLQRQACRPFDREPRLSPRCVSLLLALDQTCCSLSNTPALLPAGAETQGHPDQGRSAQPAVSAHQQRKGQPGGAGGANRKGKAQQGESLFPPLNPVAALTALLLYCFFVSRGPVGKRTVSVESRARFLLHMSSALRPFRLALKSSRC